MGQNHPYYGQFTVHGVGYSLEGDGDCLLVSQLTAPDRAVPVCAVTGKDRNYSHEVLLYGPWELPEDYRRELITAAVRQYREWAVEH